MDSLWAGSLFEERVENKPGGELGSEYESVSEESYEEEWGEEGEKTVLLIIDS